MAFFSEPLFKALFYFVSELQFKSTFDYESFTKELNDSLELLNPTEANDLLLERVSSVEVDNEMIDIYNSILQDQIDIGREGYYDEHDTCVIATVNKADRLYGGHGMDVAELFKKDLLTAIGLNAQKRNLELYIQYRAAALLEFRLANVERKAEAKSIKSKSYKNSEFTKVHQALAIKYLLFEGLNIKTDALRFVEFAHLLSSTAIPMNSDGKRITVNSSIRKALTTSTNKSLKGQLSDLRFILPFFQSLNVEGTVGISLAVKALEKDIASLLSKIDLKN